MTNRLKLFLILLIVFAFGIAGAADESVWSAHLDRPEVRPGEIARIVLVEKLKAGWHTYSIVPVADGPFPTTIKPPKADGIEGAGPIEEKTPKIEFDKNFSRQVGSFEGEAEFFVPIRVTAAGPHKVAIDLTYQVCDAHVCLPPNPITVTADFTVGPGPARSEFTKFVPKTPTSLTTAGAAAPSATGNDETSLKIRKAQDQGILPFMALAFLAGLASLLTPCVFPMIPITVSFFSKQKSDGEKSGVAGPVAYCLGIIGTFTFLGVLIGATGLNRIATNPWVNVGLAVLFVVLAASLFGVFEIRLPSALINKASSKSRAGGIAAPFLMGFTFTLTSFTCTVPFVGSLLLTSAQQGLKYSILGMLAYSTAFALPFFLLALFPGFLGKVPRSGAWLVTVKAYMGFLELMAALKFISNVDLAFSLGWVTQPVYLAIWAAIAAVGGLYLLGWLRLPHDGETKVGWLRRGFAVASIGLAGFCLAGMNGVRLGTISSFLPPDPYPGQAGRKQELNWETTYASALAQAKASGKNVFIDFTGIYCVNCRDIELNVFPQDSVKKELGKFVLAKLYTDHQGVAEDLANKELQIKLTGVESLPVYAIVSADGKVLKVHQQEPPIEDANQFLSAIRPFSSPVVASR